MQLHNARPRPFQHWSEPVRCPLLSLGTDMRRRDFIRLIGGAAAWPLQSNSQEIIRLRADEVIE